MKFVVLSALLVCVGPALAQAQMPNKFNITPEEQAACQIDATTLCSSAFPDQDALIACMRTNVTHLSPVCRRTFVAGLQRRHM